MFKAGDKLRVIQPRSLPGYPKKGEIVTCTTCFHMFCSIIDKNGKPWISQRVNRFVKYNSGFVRRNTNVKLA